MAALLVLAVLAGIAEEFGEDGDLGGGSSGGDVVVRSVADLTGVNRSKIRRVAAQWMAYLRQRALRGSADPEHEGPDDHGLNGQP